MVPSAQIKRPSDLTYEPLEKADGVEKAVIFDESDGTEHLRMRRYRLDPQATVPKHTNGVEHEIHMLTGSCVVGIENNEHTVQPGDSVLIPAGTIHWFRNETNDTCAFLCTIPADDAELQLVDASAAPE